MYTRRQFLVTASMAGLAACKIPFLFSCTNKQPGENTIQMGPLSRTSPEEQGIPSSAIIHTLNAIQESGIGFHSLMILRHGHVVAETWWRPYAKELKHSLYSLSKSFTSTAIGIAVDEGLLSVDDPVVSFFPEDIPAKVNYNLGALKIKHLLSMSVGRENDSLPPMRNGSESWARTFLQLPIEQEPGTRFLYDSGATYMLSAILQKKTGTTLLDYLRPRLFDPLGIDGMDWETNAEGIVVGGYGLRVKTEDIAKLGQLYLNRGKWGNKQIVSGKWVDEATRAQVQNAPPDVDPQQSNSDWHQGYGYQFWRGKPGGYRGDGAFGQFCIVNPDLDLVIAATSESFDMQASMRILWDNLLPAITNRKLPVNESDNRVLNGMLTSRALTVLPSSVSPQIMRKVYSVQDNDMGIRRVEITASSEQCQVTVETGASTHTITASLADWAIEENKDVPIVFPIARINVGTSLAAHAHWESMERLILTVRFTETAHGDTITFDFQGDQIRLSFQNSMASGNPDLTDDRKPLTGRLIA